MNTRGLKVLITGGGSGIGLALARRLAADNAVMIAGRDEEKLKAAIAETASLKAWPLDVGDERGAASAVDAIAEELGGLNLLVNAAGTIEAYCLEDDRSAELAERDTQINFLGSVRMTRLALPYLRLESEAAVVLISSVVAIAPAPGFAVYSATKAAVHSVARSLRRELDSVKVFDVLPTWVDTGPAQTIAAPKMSPDVVAKAIVRALERDRYEVLVGRAGTIRAINGFSPSLAEALVARASRQS
jgi:uncharacterized oxidoreductase